MRATEARNSRASNKSVLARTRALHRCKPQRQATAASTKQAANLCRLTQEPSTNASHKGQQQLQAQSKQQTCSGSQKNPAPM